MTIKSVNIGSKQPGNPKVGELAYGTVLCGIPGSKESVYIKVKKKGLAKGIMLDWPTGSCILLNILYGTLRAVDGDTEVQPLYCECAEFIRIEPDDYHNHKLFKLVR